MEQRFTLPAIPLHRDLQSTVTIGTQFSVRATPVEHENSKISLILVTEQSEAALDLTLFLPDKHGRGSKIRVLSRSLTNESSPMEKEVRTLAANKEFVLGVVVKEHVFEIYLDTIFVLPFVHRLNPAEIKKIALDGAMICNEMVIVPVKTEMPPLPLYNEVSLSMRPLQPTPAPATAAAAAATVQQQPVYPAGTVPVAAAAASHHPPAGGVPVLPPYPTAAAAAGSSTGRMPEPGWTAPQPVQPAAAAALQQPAAPPVGSPARDAAPLPPQAYPHNPPATATPPQFQNIQQVPGLSYSHPNQPQHQQQQQQYNQYPQPMQQFQQQQLQQQHPQYYPQQYQQYPGYYSPYGHPQSYRQQVYPQYQQYPSGYSGDYCHYNYYHHHHC